MNGHLAVFLVLIFIANDATASSFFRGHKNSKPRSPAYVPRHYQSEGLMVMNSGTHAEQDSLDAMEDAKEVSESLEPDSVSTPYDDTEPSRFDSAVRSDSTSWLCSQTCVNLKDSQTTDYLGNTHAFRSKMEFARPMMEICTLPQDTVLVLGDKDSEAWNLGFQHKVGGGCHSMVDCRDYEGSVYDMSRCKNEYVAIGCAATVVPRFDNPSITLDHPKLMHDLLNEWKREFHGSFLEKFQLRLAEILRHHSLSAMYDPNFIPKALNVLSRRVIQFHSSQCRQLGDINQDILDEFVANMVHSFAVDGSKFRKARNNCIDSMEQSQETDTLTDECENAVNILEWAVFSELGMLRELLETPEYFQTIRCLPTLQSSLGFNSDGLRPREYFRGQCRTKLKVTHPVFVRKAIENLMPHFQNNYRETNSVDKMSTSTIKAVFKNSMPSKCYGESEKPSSLFADCVSRAAKLLSMGLELPPTDLTVQSRSQKKTRK